MLRRFDHRKQKINQSLSHCSFWVSIFILIFMLLACSQVTPPETNPNPTPPEENPRPPEENPEPPEVVSKAHLEGSWSDVYDWPLNAIHSLLLPNGKVFTLGYGSERGNEDTRVYDLWTPSLGFGNEAHETEFYASQTTSDLFCSAQALIPSSTDILITGGTTETATQDNLGIADLNIYDYLTNRMTKSPITMTKGRWYPTITTLGNGELFVHGGYDGQQIPVDVQEVFNQDEGWRVLTGAASEVAYQGDGWYYPRSFLAPNGKIFSIMPKYSETQNHKEDFFYIDTFGKGSIEALEDIASGNDNFRYFAPAVMYDVGKILAVQGLQWPVIIDLNSETPTLSPADPLEKSRFWQDGTLLANGDVLISGGSTTENELEELTTKAEIWNPETQKWTLGASAEKARLYHSSALLLPDGSVLTAGGGQPGPVTQLNAEIYYPPYFYKRDGSGEFAERPVISANPSSVSLGQSFEVTLSGDERISEINFIRTGAATHSFDQSQRNIPLEFVQNAETLTLTLPVSANVIPPGHYLLFVVNDEGTPSVAPIIEVPVHPSPELTAPEELSHELNDVVDISLSAKDESGTSLRFVAEGLPTGLSLDASTGRLMGVVTEAAVFTVTIEVRNGHGLIDRKSIEWRVIESNAG